MYRTRHLLVTFLVVAVALIVVLGTVTVSAQEFRALGRFDDVRVTVSEEPHCYGSSLKLWQHRDQLIGLLNVHQGLCGDPPCGVLTNITFNRGTGRLSFSATTRATATPLMFSGLLRRDDVLGQMNGGRVRLSRRAGEFLLDSDESLAGWCQFWGSVGRCRGVTELCAALGQP